MDIRKNRLYVTIDDIEYEVSYSPEIRKEVARKTFIDEYLLIKANGSKKHFTRFVEYGRTRMILRQELLECNCNVVIDTETDIN